MKGGFRRGLGRVLVTAVVGACLGDGRDAANHVGLKVCGICHKKEESGNQLEK